jgi:hypothetical protein
MRNDALRICVLLILTLQERVGTLFCLNLNCSCADKCFLVSRFFAEMSKKRQRCVVVNLENNFSILPKFTDVNSSCEPQLSQNKW